MQVMAVPCLKDNYAYLVVCEQTGQAAVVDPSEVPPVLEAVQRAGVTLAAILNTHHHWDHTGGNKGLLERLPALRVYAHASDKGRVEGLTHGVQAGDELALGKLKVRV
ncbi:MAG TPA: hydroxyacylglutathione hydrolase family protein, partial [bacterium]|nr:hydroxyacylglutathione hydrolase family protein [bacterium]